MLLFPVGLPALVAFLDSPAGIEAQLRDAVSRTRVGSHAFHRTLAKFLGDHDLELKWAPNLGPSQIALGWVHDVDPGMEDIADGDLYAFWRSGHHTLVQRVSSLSQNLESVYHADAWRSGNRMVLCGGAWGGGNWTWPFAAVFKLHHNRWQMASLKVKHELESGLGTRFDRNSGEVDPSRIVATLDEYPSSLRSPQAGPFLRYNQVWSVNNSHIVAHRRRLVQTPLAELDRLASLADDEDWSELRASVPVSHRHELIELLQNPGAAEVCGNAHTLTCDGNPDLRMHFAKRGLKWRLVGVSESRS